MLASTVRLELTRAKPNGAKRKEEAKNGKKQRGPTWASNHQLDMLMECELPFSTTQVLSSQMSD